jgi:hypothetical protein
MAAPQRRRLIRRTSVKGAGAAANMLRTVDDSPSISRP